MTLILERSINGGTQKLHKFDNGFGASVVQHSFSYGTDLGLWELAVVVFDGDAYELTYETEITDDVLGYLTEEDVSELLVQIENLKA